MPHIEVGEIQLYYEAYGEGEPLVLIPGFRTGLWLWFKQAEALSQKFRVIVFDPRGISQSVYTGEPFTTRTLADDLAGLLAALGIERAHVLGASFGGFVAQEFAIAYPQMTRSLILCCTSSGGPGHLLPSASTVAALANLEGLNTEERTRKDLLGAFAPEFVRDHPDEVEAFIARRLQHPVTDWAHFGQLQAAAAFDASQRVASIKAPTLVLVGEQDTIVPPGNSLNLAEQIPQAQLICAAGGGHMFFIEQYEEFNDTVIEFIEQTKNLDS